MVYGSWFRVQSRTLNLNCEPGVSIELVSRLTHSVQSSLIARSHTHINCENTYMSFPEFRS